MKKALLLFASILLLASCSKVRFAEPQPLNAARLFKIPAKLVGEYVDDRNDTLYITEDYFYGSDIDRKTVNSEGIVLKKKGFYYFLSTYDMTTSGGYSLLEGWEVLPFQLKDDTLYVYQIDTSTEQLTGEALSNLKEFVGVERKIYENKEYYIVNPDIQQFEQIMYGGVFTLANKFAKVN